MKSFQDRLKFGTEAEDIFELMLKEQILPNKGYERFTFEYLQEKHGWNIRDCQNFTKVHGDFHVDVLSAEASSKKGWGESYMPDGKYYFDVKGTEKVSETSLMEATEGLIFAMNFHISRDHCFFLPKSQYLVEAIKNRSKEVTLASGDKGYSIYAAEELSSYRVWTKIPRKVLSLKNRLRKEIARKETLLQLAEQTVS